MYIEYYAEDGSLKCLGDNELYHYNHKHDALGRFAKTVGSVSSKKASSPSQYKRKANKLEKLSSKGRAKAMEKEYKAGKLSKKGKKAAAKLQKAQAKRYKDIASEARNSAKKTAGEAFSKNHYTVSEKIYRKNTQAGRDLVVYSAIGALVPGPRAVRIGTALGYRAAANSRSYSKYGSKNKGEHPREMYTKKYSVKKTRNGKKSSYTSANQVYDNNGQYVPVYTKTITTGQTVNRKKKK